MKNEKLKKAVALKYPEGAPAPFITASAKGKLAEELLKCAKMNDIIIIIHDITATSVVSGFVSSFIKIASMVTFDDGIVNV